MCSRTRTPTRWRRAFRSPAPSRIRETSLFATIASVLRNAFVSAFARSLEGSITLRDVKKNLNELDSEAPEDETDKKDSKAQGQSGAEAANPDRPGKS